jgi:hypothetical protein
MCIYVLIDPRDGAVRYVGKTSHPCTRRSDHMSEARGSTGNHRLHWLRALLALGLEPSLEVIEEVAGNGNEEERRWIAAYREEGHDLVNATDGGEGVAMTPEVRARIGAAKRGSTHTDASCQQMSASASVRWARPEQKAAMSEANRRRHPAIRGAHVDGRGGTWPSKAACGSEMGTSAEAINVAVKRGAPSKWGKLAGWAFNCVEAA